MIPKPLLTLYRRTIRRITPLHAAVHGLMTRAGLPLLERVRGFRTLPDDPFWFRLELLTGRHEKETLAVVEHLLLPGMVVLDVGAHVGYYARRFADMVGDGGKVFAFEPHPRNHAMLVRNTRGARCVTAVQAALSDKAGTAELYDYLMMSASGSLHYDESLRDLQQAQQHAGDIAPRIAGGFQPQTFTVQTITADDFLAQHKLESVDLIKMDIEGAELDALRGMAATIARSPGLALIMEYNPQALKGAGHDPVAALDEVLGMGFAKVGAIQPDGQILDLTGDGEAITALTARLMEHMDVVNLLFTRAP